MKNFSQIINIVRGVSKIFLSIVVDPVADCSMVEDDKKSFTSDIGGYSYSYGYKCRSYNNGLTSTEDSYGNLQFSNGEYATVTSEGYYYFSDGTTGYEDSYGNIILDNGQIIIKE